MVEFSNVVPQSHLLLPPLKGIDEGVLLQKDLDDFGEGDDEGLLDDDPVVIRHGEGVHVAGVENPAGVH